MLQPFNASLLHSSTTEQEADDGHEQLNDPAATTQNALPGHVATPDPQSGTQPAKRTFWKPSLHL